MSSLLDGLNVKVKTKNKPIAACRAKNTPSLLVLISPAAQLRSFFSLTGSQQHHLKLGHFSRRQFTPLARGEACEAYVHDAHAFELGDVKTEVFGHAADLPVQALAQHDIKGLAGLLRDLTWQSHSVKNWHASGHFFQEIVVNRFVDSDDILFVVRIASTQYFIDDIAVIGEEN